VAFFPQLGFNAYVSHSPSKNIGVEQGIFINAQGILQNFTNNRRTTGGNGFGVGPVATVTPWQGGRLTGEVNYENVGYDNDFPVNQNARGFGVTARINQKIAQNVDVGLGAAIRQPFNNYAANMSWSEVPYLRDWTLGLFGDYTIGKHTLPDTYNIGISADFFLDRRTKIAEISNLKNEVPILEPVVDNLLSWTASPAVYMPVVMSVADQQVERS
jgi:hypothetical protein